MAETSSGWPNLWNETACSITTSVSGSNGQIEAIVACLRYKKGWTFALEAFGGVGGQRVLVVKVATVDSTPGTEPVTVTEGGLIAHSVLISHQIPIPPELSFSAYREQIEDWLFETICQIERHESGEFFTVDGERPYLPLHGPGVNPYDVRRRSEVVESLPRERF